MVHMLVSLTLRGRGTVRDSIPDVSQSTTSLTSSSSVAQVGMVPHYLDQWRLLPTALCSIWLKATISILGPSLCCFVIFTGSTLMLLLLIIQKEVQKLLAKVAVEPLTDGAGFHYNVFVVPKH